MLASFSLTDVGRKRQMNQDYIFASEKKIGNLPNLFIVADGMGGYNGGGFASCYATEVIRKVIENSSETNPRKLFEIALITANSEIRKKAFENPDLERMGTTAVIASVIGDCLQIANVGDSRLYVFNDEIRQVTVDHSFVEEMIRVGTLDKESARTHPKKNIITRAIGADDFIIPDYFTLKLDKNDKILMCSDGLSNMISDEGILDIVKNGSDIESTAKCLVDTANKNGGLDNIAVIVIDPFNR